MMIMALILAATTSFAGIQIVSGSNPMQLPHASDLRLDREQVLTLQAQDQLKRLPMEKAARAANISLKPEADPRGGTIIGSVTGPQCPEGCEYDVDVLALNKYGFVLSSDWVWMDGRADYELSGLPPGDYYVFTLTQGWDDDVHQGTLINEFYDNTTDWNQASLVTVTAGGTTDGIDLDLESNSGFVSVTVNDGSGQPLANTGVEFELYPYAPAEEDIFTEGHVLHHTVTTDDAGVATVGPIPLGTFYLSCRALNFGRIFYPNTPDPEQAQSLEITTPDQTITGITFNLPPGGNIAGIITLDTGEAAFGTMVDVYEIGSDSSIAMGMVFNFDGSYIVEGIAPGNYVVRADPSFASPGYMPEYYDDKPTAESANPVTVQPGQTTEGIDFVLAQGGAISGTVDTDVPSADEFLFFVSAFAPDDSTFFVAMTFAEAGEEYIIGGLRPGQYIVSLQGFPFPLLPIYYDDVHSFDQATPVTVTGTSTTTGIDFNLPARGIIEGAVTLAGGGTADNDIVEFVIAYPESIPLEGDVLELFFMYPAPVDENGSYTIWGLPTGNYKVWASTTVGDYDEIGYVSEYYGGVFNFPDAPTIQVTEDQTTSGIDIELDQEAIVQGYVHMPDGSPASDEDIQVLIVAYDAESGAPTGFSLFDEAPIYTEEDNTFCAGYRIRRLPARQVKLAAVPMGAQAAVGYYGGGHTFDQGGTVQLTAGEAYASDLDIHLTAANQTIKGRVTNSEDAPLNWVIVTSYDLTGHLTGVSSSGFDPATGDEWQAGRYEIQSLASGSTHYVRTWSLMAWVRYIFLNEGADIIPADEWYDDVPAPLLPMEMAMFMPFGYYYFFGFMPFEQDVPLEATQVSASSSGIDFALGYQGMGSDEKPMALPDALTMDRVWPNPTQKDLTVELALQSPQQVRLEILDLAGRTVGTLEARLLPRGLNHIRIPMGQFDNTVASGVYTVRAIGQDGASASNRFVVLR